MGPDRDEATEAQANMTYPSPGAEGSNAGPFYSNAQDEVPDHHQPEHTPEQHLADHVAEHEPAQKQEQVEMSQHDTSDHHHQEHAQQQQQHEQQHHQQQQQHEQHNHQQPNLEELQLAAQLGHNIASEPMMPATDPNMNANMEANMGMEDPNLRSIMPQPEAEQQQHDTSYLHDTPTSNSMMPHDLPASIAAQLPPQYVMADNIPPRKRSKVSRACDECRRKKIKCDAQLDNGDMPCSSCSRSNIKCLFSRVPQKRGPSKGYIKELADRIHSIENKLDSEGGLSHEDLSTLFGDRSRLSNAGEDSSKKRPYSSISGGEFESPAAQRQSPWASDHRPIQPATAQQDQPTTPYTNAMLAPQPVPPKTDGFQKSSGGGDVSMTGFEDVPELDDGVLQDYLGTLQVLYPILPTTPAHQQALLTLCPSPLRTAFTHALLAVAQSSSGNIKLANLLLSDIEGSETQRSQTERIVHAQTLMLLLIDADWRGSVTLPSLLARSVALAGQMQLWRYTAIDPESDPDSEDNLLIRIWWSIVLMDRFHAVGTSKPTMIQDHSVVIPHGVHNIIGETCFYLLRLSKVLGRIARVTSSLEAGVSTSDRTTAGILHDHLEDYREDLPAHIEPSTHPLVHLCYWHCRLVVTMLNPETIHSELLWPTKELINLLSANEEMRNPLTNHFGYLIALALSNLSKMDGSREEAANLTRSIVDNPGVVWDSIRDRLQDQMRPTSSSAVDAATLQHLADLATAHQGSPGAAGAGGDEGAAGGNSLAQGYLSTAV